MWEGTHIARIRTEKGEDTIKINRIKYVMLVLTTFKNNLNVTKTSTSPLSTVEMSERKSKWLYYVENNEFRKNYGKLLQKIIKHFHNI